MSNQEKIAALDAEHDRLQAALDACRCYDEDAKGVRVSERIANSEKRRTLIDQMADVERQIRTLMDEDATSPAAPDTEPVL